MDSRPPSRAAVEIPVSPPLDAARSGVEERFGAPSLWLLFLAVGAWTAALSPFVTVILRAHGVSTAAIGVLAALGAIGTTTFSPLWGHIADAVAGRARAFEVAVLIAAGAAALLLLPLPLALVALVVATFSIYPGLFAGLADALAIGGLPHLERQYGALRAASSLSFGVAAIAAGFVYDRSGYDAAPLVSLVWVAVLLASLRLVPDPTRDTRYRLVHASGEEAAAVGRLGSVSRAFAVQPRLGAVLAVFTIAYAGLLGGTTFVGIRIVELGGQPSDVALTYGISSFAEIPGLVLATWLGRRIGLRWIVALSLAGYGLCVASWGVISVPIAINATRFVTGLCFGALMTGRVLITARLLPPELQATGQTLLMAVSYGLGTALGAVVGGFVYGALGATVFFAGAAALAIGGGAASVVVLGREAGARIASG